MNIKEIGLVGMTLLFACNSKEEDRSGYPPEDTMQRSHPVEERKIPGTREDSIKTNANPLYEGDNRDTL